MTPEELKWRMQARKRAEEAFDREVCLRVLAPLGRVDILDDLPVNSVSLLNEHCDMFGTYPLRLEAYLFNSLDPELPDLPSGEKPLADVALKGFPASDFAKVCFAPDYDHADWAERGLAVVFARDDEKMILHNRPDLTAGPAEFARDLPNGCPLRVHYFAPFVDDIADEVRLDMANEEVEELMASSHPFREAWWEDYYPEPFQW